MDTSALIQRVKNILLTPKTEWPVIAAEPDSVAALYRRYILVLAALPAVAGFIKQSILGIGVPMVGIVRIGIGVGLLNMVLQYVAALVTVYVIALLIDALAPTFGGQKDPTQALKTSAYAWTASWVAGALVVVPWLGGLIALAGGIYGIYLLYLGLPVTMKAPPDRAAAYTAVTVACAIVLSLVLSVVLVKLTGAGAYGGAGGSGSSFEISSGDGSIRVDESQLEDWARKMEAAGQKLEAAQKSGDLDAQQKAAGEAMSAMLGGGGETVEALAPDQLKPFLPEALEGMTRRSFSVERNEMMGMQVAQGSASFQDENGEKSVDLEIIDMGGARGLMAMAGWTLQTVDRQTEEGYEKVYRDGGRMVHEEWSESGRSGTYGIVLADRFSVTLSGSGLSMDELKGIAASLKLSELEALKKSGVKPS